MYKCVCGREFESAQSFNGHKSHCIAHHLEKYGNLDKLQTVNKHRSLLAGKTNTEHARERKSQRTADWIAEQHKCEHCGKIMTTMYGSGRFCCVSCATSRKITEETKQKLKKCHSVPHLVTCSQCGTAFTTNDYSRKLCYTCLPKTVRYAKMTHTPKSLFDLSSRTRSKVLLRLDIPCLSCGFHVPGVVLDTHHIQARAAQGSDDLSNITYICPNCHRLLHTACTKSSIQTISLADYFKDQHINWLDYYYVV